MVNRNIAALSLLLVSALATTSRIPAYDSQTTHTTPAAKTCSTKTSAANHGPSSGSAASASSVASSLTINTKNASGSSSKRSTKLASASTGASSSLGLSRTRTRSSNTVTALPSSSGSRSSNAPSRSSQSAGITTSASNDDACPTYTNLLTYTYTDTSYTYTWNNPTSTTTLTLVYTSVVTAPGVTTVTAEYGPNISTYTFAADTRTILTIAPAETTVRVAANSGFIPVKCQSDYYQPTTTIAVTATQTLFGDIATEVLYTSTTQETAYSYTSTSTSSVYVTTSYESNVFLPIVTVATTRLQATSTIYEACATNNVTPDYPGGNYTHFFTSQNNPQNGSTGPFDVSGQLILAADARDCCQICQATANCTGSAWRPFKPNQTSPLDFYDTQNCYLITRTAATEQACSLSDPAQIATLPQPEPLYYLSNGPCGRWNFIRQYPIFIPF